LPSSATEVSRRFIFARPGFILCESFSRPTIRPLGTLLRRKGVRGAAASVGVVDRTRWGNLPGTARREMCASCSERSMNDVAAPVRFSTCRALSPSHLSPEAGAGRAIDEQGALWGMVVFLWQRAEEGGVILESGAGDWRGREGRRRGVCRRVCGRLFAMAV
jgi:hypothetical protein